VVSRLSSRTGEARVGIFSPKLVKRFGEKIPTLAALVRDDRGKCALVRDDRGKCAFVLLLALVAYCSSSTASGGGPQPNVCTFTNPVATGADPWVVKQNGTYYLAQSKDNGIWVYASPKLSSVASANGTRVWSAPDTGWNRTNIWAPELHFIDGRWYIYYAGGRSGPPFIAQHAGVLQSAGAEPLGPYTDMGMLYTGDDIAGGTGNRWSIDLTVHTIGSQLYAVWSGWESDATTDRTPQHLYIARMSNPWTIATNRVKLSSPTASWERGTELDLEEGPEFLTHGDQVFIVYSTRESWLKDYQLGQLRLSSATADPMDPASWIKSGPVFSGTVDVFGVGHASFTTSPDDSESWIVYHSKISATPGWDRVIRMQKFSWGADGAPTFGLPAPAGQAIAQPSGECK